MSDENSEPVPQVDLFGQPILPIRDRRGRPSFRKDKTNQDFVAVRVAAGWTQKAIADDMGIDEKTLRKHFSRELEVGRLSIEGLMLDVLLKLVREGKTAAVGRLHEMMKAAGPQAPRSRGASLDEDDETEDDRPVKVGKKEQAQRDAQDIPPDYGDIFARMQRH